MVEMKFPDVGEGIEEGEIVKVYVKVGERVKADQTLVDVETDKAVVNLPAPSAGMVTEILVKPGQRIKVGQVLLTIGEKGEEPTKRSVGVMGELEEAPEEVAAPEHEKFVFKDGHHAKTLRDLVGLLQTIHENDFQHHMQGSNNDFANWIRYSLKKDALADSIQPLRTRTEMVAALQKKKGKAGKGVALPKVRQLAKEQGVDLAAVEGSGPDGRVMERDLHATGKVQVAKKYDLWGYIERVPVRGMRRTIAERMSKAWSSIPHVTQCEDVDVTDVAGSYLPLVMKACVAGLKQFPLLNATLEAEEILVKKYYNLGFAVATDDGLVVPVVKRAEQKDIPALEKEMKELAEKARKRKIDVMDLKGGSFTITNIGSIGGTYFTPIINAPEVAILGMGRVGEKVMSVKGKIMVRKILPLSLSFDHRVVDGAYAAQFLNALKKQIENV